MQRLALMSLLKIELPSRDVLLCDGGFIVFDSQTYRNKDDLFGTVASVDPLEEGLGEEVPALELTFLPPAAAAVADLSQPGYQKSRVRMWLAEYDVDTGLVSGTPDLMFDGQVDQTTLKRSRDGRELAVSVVSTAERLFAKNKGNSLSPTFHKSVWPGETGHDNASGLQIPVAWGVEKPQAGNGSFVHVGGSWADKREWRSELMATV